MKEITYIKEWLEKNTQEAVFMGKPYSAIVFNFGPDEENHYIIDEYLFQELLEYSFLNKIPLFEFIIDFNKNKDKITIPKHTSTILKYLFNAFFIISP
mgnify:CR=1 FL=1